MPRLFVGNFDFEHRLAGPQRQLPLKLHRLNAELATSWLAIAEDGDTVWTPESIDAAFFEQASAEGLPRVTAVTSLDRVPAGVECVPWGWTNDLRHLAEGHGWNFSAPPDKAVRAVNSRRFSAALEHEWRVGLDFAGEATSAGQVERFVEFHGAECRWVIKAEFGMSGRERLIGRGLPTEADRNWIEKRLHANGVVFFEPWVENLGEVGIQIEIPRRGEPKCVDVVPMIADQRGQYCGSQLLSEVEKHSQVMLRSTEWGLAMDFAMQAARRIQDAGYFGPVGIDAMEYRDANGQVRIRPLQDINARWTMGRLCLGFRRLLRQRESAVWFHGTEKLTSAIDSRNAIRILREFLHTKELSLSVEREDVVRAVFELQQIFSVDELLDTMDSTRISRSTIARTLSFLEQAGLINVVSEKDGHKFYWHNRPSGGRRIAVSPEIVGEQPSLHVSQLWID